MKMHISNEKSKHGEDLNSKATIASKTANNFNISISQFQNQNQNQK